MTYSISVLWLAFSIACVRCQPMFMNDLGVSRLLPGHRHPFIDDVTPLELQRQTVEEIMASMDWLHNMKVSSRPLSGLGEIYRWAINATQAV